MPTQKPKAFISYSWTNLEHEQRIVAWAERLVADGVDVVFDKWNLKAGGDKFHFLEQSATVKSVTHVLVFCDRRYSEKANAREGGVGTESQILSPEVYGKMDQAKILPVICEYDAAGRPFMPAFLATRIYFDFSSPEKTNDEWPRLIRHLYDQPLYVKPALGSPPNYITNPQQPVRVTIGRFQTAKDAISKGSPAAAMALNDYFELFYAHLETFRIQPEEGKEFDESVVASLDAFLPYRDELIEIFMSVVMASPQNASEPIGDFLERLLYYKFSPNPDKGVWQETWADNFGFFLWELFLYTIAVFVKAKACGPLGELLTRQYVVPPSGQRFGRKTFGFTIFLHYSRTLARRNERLKLNRTSVAADLIKTRATHPQYPFHQIMQADFIAFLRAGFSKDEWFPFTLIYAAHGTTFDLFIRAREKKGFLRLSEILGVFSKEDLVNRYATNIAPHLQSRYRMSTWDQPNFEELMNLNELDTL
jgi:hypothetical protein